MLDIPGTRGLEIEALSEKGRALLGRGDWNLAIECSEHAMRLLETQQGIATEAQRFYFTHYKILLAKQRSGEAQLYLQKAYQALRQVAEEIDDAALKKSFLENVSINHQILQSWRELQQANP